MTPEGGARRLPRMPASTPLRNEDVAEKAPELRHLDLLDEAWRVRSHGRRHDAVRDAAHSLRKLVSEGPRVLSVRTLPLVRAPYGTKFAFRGAAWSPAPLVLLNHRCLLVQFMQGGVPKTLLFNPTDLHGARTTPYFARIEASTPKLVAEMLSPPFPTLEAQLADLGVRVDDVDYIAFDHFHVQDLRPTMGTVDGRLAARFPRAKLLAPRVEWDDWARLHPLQRAFYVAEGRTGVQTSRVVFTDSDLVLGDGVYLVRTPGHTSGNQTLFLATDKGVWGCSENGVAADSWSPIDSNISGLKQYARHNDVDLVLNLNTPESGVDQYTSMTLERLVVDRVARAPAFVQMFPSSELMPSAIAPGLAPTVQFERITVGDVLAPTASDHAVRRGATEQHVA
jgi:hypothetical protein